MAKLPDLTSKELIIALTKIGFESVRQKGRGASQFGTE